MKHLVHLIVVATGVLSCAAAGATCYGQGSFQTCNDGAGNSHTVKRYGDSLQAQGTDARTGKSWSQSTRINGDTARHEGRTADGASWSGTSQLMGNGATFHRGVDIQGRSYTKICPATGCVEAAGGDALPPRADHR